MHEDAPVLTATRRERTGSRYAARVRDAGGLPAVVYGHGEEPLSISVNAKETLRLLHKGEKIFQLQFEGEDSTHNVLVKDLQFDYLGTNVVHADFARVDLEERMVVHVAIHLVGEAKGLKTTGAILMHQVEEIEIECKIANMPEYIELDISDLDAGGTVTAGDVQLPLPTMVLKSDPNMALAHIVVQGEAPEEGEAGEAGGAAQPEVLTEKKAEE